ncbi:uncharacterized protein [Haliotis cracherodii]|uniref:uncharacterized protein n=1 Tax=Haliotis cracherodii TaxID=6455 RepID=UPI0039ECF37B
MQHSLFELSRLLSLSQETRGSVKSKTSITQYAWKEEGEVNLLALACSNDQIVLRYSIAGKPPLIKQLSWIPNKTIVAMCFDPTVTWLLILTHEPDIYLVPAFSLMEPKARVNQLWNTDDVTHIKLQQPKGDVCVVSWWHTLDDQQVAVIGTRAGEIIFVDLLRKKTVVSTRVETAILKLDLVMDDQQMTTSLLITASRNNQWKLLLESRSIDRMFADLGFDGTETSPDPVNNILVQTDENREKFLPLRYEQFQRSVILCPQNARGRHFITAHEDKTSTFQVYDSHVEHSPLFVYKLPIGAYNVILTDRLIFTTSRVSGRRLLIISNQRAETSLEDHQDFNKESIVQQFDLPQDETLLGVQKKCFPFYWHEKREEERLRSVQEGEYMEQPTSIPTNIQAIPVTSHTVLDGCIVITNRGIYECRPRISPERLFLGLAIQHTDAAYAESLGISIGLDLTALFEVAADYLLRAGEFSRSVRLYQLSKCSHVKRVGNLARHGRLQEVTSVLRQVLNNHQVELSTIERKQLADMALHCCVYFLSHDADRSSGMDETFKEFLFGSFSFDEMKALRLLSDFSLHELLLEFAKARGLVVEALELLSSRSQFNVPTHLLSDLVTRGFSAHLLQAGQGSLLQCISADDLVRLLLTKPQLAIQNVGLMENQLGLLEEELLVSLAEVFDPSRPVMRGILNRHQYSRRRTTSISSLTSFTSDVLDFSGDMGTSNLCQLMDFFISVVLHLNKKRDADSVQLDLADMLADINTQLEELREKKQPVVEMSRKLALQPTVIGCGSHHTAIIRNSDLYVWGLTNNGRLGHGDLVTENSLAAPARVETLHMLQMRVLSVACGGEHTLVITQQGVYGWGRSQYGQVGVGTRHSYTRPMLIESLLPEMVVSIECGQYHSLALTENSDVYSWGWGVHGQLGHCDPEDQLSPTLVKSLRGKDVVRIAAGYCHSLVLNDKGAVYSFGCGYFGQLGQGDNSKKSCPTRISLLPEPVSIIATKYFHSIAVTSSNRVYSWGCHPHSLRYSAQLVRRARQLGQHLSDPVESYLSPSIVDSAYVNGKITQVTCGSLHTILQTSEGEIYVFGRNMDGQLGIGSKQDEKIPRMLTKINDHNIVCVKSGGEFNIAMDTENTVWVWGKNDTAQLGYHVIEISSQALRVTRSRRRSTPSSTDFLSPTILKGLPAQDPTVMSPWQQSFMASSESGDSEFWVTDGKVEDHHLAMIPNLEKVGKVRYSRKVIPVVLKYLPHLCQITTALIQCVDAADWLTAADIHLLSHCHSQALLCQLQVLTDRKPFMSAETFRHFSIQVIQHHIRCTVSGDNTPSELREELNVIIVEVLDYWEKHDLAVVDLEAIFLHQLTQLAPTLSLLLFRCHDKHEEAPAALLGPSGEFLEKFSTDFCLKLLHSVLSSSSRKPSTLPKQWMSLLQHHEVGAADSGADMVDIKPEPTQTRPRVDIQPCDKLIPYDRLWQDIVQNLQKHADSRSYISLTRNEMDHIEVQMEEKTNRQTDRKETQTDTIQPDDPHSAILFTCGHHFTRTTFTDEVLVSFDRELTEGPNKLPYSATVLKQYYSRQGLLPLACPKCVLNALMTIS